jgi:hypothetical protein
VYTFQAKSDEAVCEAVVQGVLGTVFFAPPIIALKHIELNVAGMIDLFNVSRYTAL